ncbi:MAG: hypothetical protein A2505_01465 [Deltaproteobacteria bacterium RIFOXYD12_FULL_55_16]|nr:MAG: hypothetical protein A2505_01465 [Deltaproteobacteria bacterium RIFOXYD12_FULL_55_16]
MPYKNHGFRHGFLAALNQCVTTSFFTAPLGTGQDKNNRLVSELVSGAPRNLARERYLAIPTFIRQGKILGL